MLNRSEEDGASNAICLSPPHSQVQHTAGYKCQELHVLQTSWETDGNYHLCLQPLIGILQVVTDILHNVVVIYQCNVLMLSIFLMARVIQPLPCSLVSLFTGAWQFVLLLAFGCWNFISIIQLSIIFEKTTFLDLESNKVLRFCWLYAAIFAGGGLVIESNFVRHFLHNFHSS